MIQYHDSSSYVLDRPKVQRQKQDDRDEDANEGGRVDGAANQVDEDCQASEENMKKRDNRMAETTLNRSESTPIIHFKYTGA